MFLLIFLIFQNTLLIFRLIIIDFSILLFWFLRLDWAVIQISMEPLNGLLLWLSDHEILGFYTVLPYLAARLLMLLLVHVSPTPGEPSVKQKFHVIDRHFGWGESHAVVLQICFCALLIGLRVYPYSLGPAVSALPWAPRVIGTPGQEDGSPVRINLLRKLLLLDLLRRFIVWRCIFLLICALFRPLFQFEIWWLDADFSLILELNCVATVLEFIR